MDSGTTHGRPHPFPQPWCSQLTLRSENMAAFHVTTRRVEKETTFDIQRRQSYKTYNAHKRIGQSDLNSFTQQNVLSTYCVAVIILGSVDIQSKRERNIRGFSCVCPEEHFTEVSYSGRVLCLRNYDHLSGVGGSVIF